MTNHDILDMIGDARGAFVMEAQSRREGTKNVISSHPRNRFLRNIAAIAAIVLICAVLLQTPVGAAAVELVKEGFSRLINTLFPPKEIVVIPEGEPVAIPHEAQGRDPEEDTMGFAIYVDTERYVMTQEEDAWFIRPINVSPELPPCEMEIREFPDKDPVALGQETKDQYIADGWDMVGDLWESANGLAMDVANGIDALAPYEGHYFRNNGKGGTFHIIIRYFMEATEGHGTRLAAMYNTFTLIAPQDASGYTGGYDTLIEAMHQELNYAAETDQDLTNYLLNEAMTQADMNVTADKIYALWLDTFKKLWSALEQVMDEESMDALTEEQLEWSNQKEAIIKAKTAELEGGSLMGTVFFDANAKMLKERCQQLMQYLDGTLPVPERIYSSVINLEAVVKDFTEAWIRGDKNAMKQHLSSEYTWEIDVCSDSNPVIHAYKGLNATIVDMLKQGCTFPSIEYRPTPDSDSYQYLSLTAVWENGCWKILSYCIEG